MTRVLAVEPGYCPYQAGFVGAAEAAAQVVEADSETVWNPQNRADMQL